MYKKLIITFEGIEGSGKSTHISFVAKYLKSKNIKFAKIREPGGSNNSEKIRKLILKKNSNFSKTTDLLLYLAARSENIDKIIKQNYQKKIILIDRFTDSTLAYQHYGMGLNRKIIETINSFLLKKIKINFTFLNTVSEKNLHKRLNKRKNLNRYDKFKFSFYNKVQKGFIKLSKSNKKKYLIINSNNNLNENRKIIINKINTLI